MEPEVSLISPFPEWAWPSAWSWLEPVRGLVADDFFPKTIEQFVEYSIRSYRRAYGAVRAGQVGGAIAFEQASPAMAIAHVLFAPWFIRERGAAARSLYLACERLFAETETVKVLGLIPEHNRLAIAMATRNGGKLEGVLRSHTLRDGKPVNAVAVGITREEWGELDGSRFGSRQQLRADEQQRERVDEQFADVLGGSGRPAVDAGASVPEPSAGSGKRGPEPERAEHGDRERGRDQQELSEPDGPDQSIPRVSRVRPKRAGGPKRAADQHRAPRRSGAKPKQRLKPAAPAK